MKFETTRPSFDEVFVRLVERAARPAFEAGELATLVGWLEALPAERVAVRPELVSLQAWALFEAGQVGAAVALAGRHLASSDARGPADLPLGRCWFGHTDHRASWPVRTP